MSRLFFLFALLLFSTMSTLGQICSVPMTFPDIHLPFETNDDSFDSYAADDPIVLEEETAICLCKDNNDYWVKRAQYSSARNTYYDFFTVGKFYLFDKFYGFLFYMDFNTDSGYYIELVLSIVDSTSQKVLFSSPVSVIDDICRYYSKAMIIKEADNKYTVSILDSTTEYFLYFTKDEEGEILINKQNKKKKECQIQQQIPPQ